MIFYAIIIFLGLLFIGFFIKSPFLSMAVFCVTLYLLLIPDFRGTWLYYSFTCILVWSIAASVKRFFDWRYD